MRYIYILNLETVDDFSYQLINLCEKKNMSAGLSIHWGDWALGNSTSARFSGNSTQHFAFRASGRYGLPVIGHCNYSAVITAVITCNYTSPFSVTCNLSPAPLCPPSAVRPCVSPCLCAFVSTRALRNHKGELITDANEQQIKVWARR